MTIILISLFLVIAFFSIFTNRDLFSPAKYYLLSFLIFFGSIAGYNQYSQAVRLLSLLVLMIGALAAIFESARLPVVKHFSSTAEPTKELSVLRRIWLFTTIPILAQAYLIVIAGGWTLYLEGYGNRVISLRGYGPAVILMMSISALNLAYLSISLLRPRSVTWWLCFGLHLGINICLMALTGSRSGILMIFATQLILFNYLVRRIKPQTVVGVCVLLIGLGLLLGILRESKNWLDKIESLDIAIIFDNLDRVALGYGTQPLQLILDSDSMPLAYGTTFFSVVTNPIPREWWPGKFDSGGVFITKAYADDAWEGASNITPTFLGEWVINFGWGLGIAFYIISSILITHMLFRCYRRMLKGVRGIKTVKVALDLVFYIYTLLAVVGLMVGEVTNVVVYLVLAQLIPIMALRMKIGWRTSPLTRTVNAQFVQAT